MLIMTLKPHRGFPDYATRERGVVMNTLKTTFLLSLLTVLLVLAGGAIGGQGGMLIALVMAGVMNLVSYWFSDKIVLAMYGAKAITEAENPEFYGLVRELAARA